MFLTMGLVALARASARLASEKRRPAAPLFAAYFVRRVPPLALRLDDTMRTRLSGRLSSYANRNPADRHDRFAGVMPLSPYAR